MANKINGTDTLRLAYPKLNEMIDEVNTFQEQIDTIVIEGDSSVEAAQARVSISGETHTTLKERLDSEYGKVTADLAQIAIHVNQYGAIGDGSNETAKIQAAIDYASTVNGRVIFDKTKTYMIDAVTGLFIKDNVTLDFSNGAKLKAIPNDQHRYRILKISDSQNIKIISPYLIGDRDEHITTPSSEPNNTDGFYGEWGYGLEIRGGKNIQVDNFYAEKCWGDGIVIVSSDTATAENFINNENIVFTGKTVVKNCRRQGMSVLSVDGLRVDSFYAEGIRGTLPSSAIDFEPDFEYQEIKNVSIGDVTAVDCAESVLFSFKGKFDISIERVNTIDCTNSFSAHGLGFNTENNAGNIKIGTWFVNKIVERSAISLNNWYVGFTPKIYINQFIIEEWDNSTTNFLPEDFCAYLRLSETKDASVNTTMLVGGGIFIGNIICLKANMGTRPFRYAYLFHNGVTAPSGFLYKEIYLGFSEESVKTDTRSIGVDGNNIVKIRKPFNNKIVTTSAQQDLNTLEPTEKNQLGFDFYSFDTGNASVLNAPTSGRGAIIQYNDSAYGKVQLALMSSANNAIRTRRVMNDGTTRPWRTLIHFADIPTSKTSAGQIGDFAADANYMYVCYGANQWIRVPKDNTW